MACDSEKIVKNSGCEKIETCEGSLSEPNKNITFQDERQLNADDSNIDANNDISHDSSCSSITIIDSSSDISHDSSISSISLHNEEFELKKFKKIKFPNSLPNSYIKKLLNDAERSSEIKLDESYSSSPYVNEINVFNEEKCDTIQFVKVNGVNNRFISSDSKKTNSNLNKSNLQENDLKLRMEGNLIPYRALINGSEHVFYAPIGGTVHLFYPPTEKIGHLYYAGNDNVRLYYLTCGNTVHYYNIDTQTLVCTSEVIDGMSLSSITTAHSAKENIVDKDLSLPNDFQVNYYENSKQEPLSFQNKVTLGSDLNIKVDSNNTNLLPSLQTKVRKSMQNTNESNGVSLPNQNLNDFKIKNGSFRSQSHKGSESFMPISSKYFNENDLCENNARQQNKSNFISSLQSIAQNYSDPQHSPSKEIKLPSISKNKNLNLKPWRSTHAKLLEPKIIYTNLSPIPSPISIKSKYFLNTTLNDSFIETSTNNIHTSSPKIYAENISDNHSNSKSFAIHTLTQNSPGQKNRINIDAKNKTRVKQLKSTFNEKHDNLTNDRLFHQTLNHDNENIDKKAFEMSAQFDGAISPINTSFLQPYMQAVVNSLLQGLYLPQPNINFPHQPLNQTAEPLQYLNLQQQQQHRNCVHVRIKNLYMEPRQNHQHPG